MCATTTAMPYSTIHQDKSLRFMTCKKTNRTRFCTILGGLESLLRHVTPTNVSSLLPTRNSHPCSYIVSVWVHYLLQIPLSRHIHRVTAASAKSRLPIDSPSTPWLTTHLIMAGRISRRPPQVRQCSSPAHRRYRLCLRSIRNVDHFRSV